MIKLAFSKPTNDQTKAELFGSFRAAGFGGLQLKGDHRPYLDCPQKIFDDWPALRGGISGVILGGKLDAPGTELLRKTFRFAAATGTELVIFCHGEKREGLTLSDIRAFAKPLQELGQEARQLGTKLSIHNHFNNPLMHRDDLAAFFDEIRDGSVGLTVDTAHLAKSGVIDIAGTIRQFKGVIDNFHMKDLRGAEFQVLGRGALDFAPIFAAVREIGYSGWVSADEESPTGMQDALQTCHAFLKNGLLA